MRVPYPYSADEIDAVVAQFIEEYLRLCPELANYSRLNVIRKIFNVA